MTRVKLNTPSSLFSEDSFTPLQITIAGNRTRRVMKNKFEQRVY